LRTSAAGPIRCLTDTSDGSLYPNKRSRTEARIRTLDQINISSISAIAGDLPSRMQATGRVRAL